MRQYFFFRERFFTTSVITLFLLNIIIYYFNFIDQKNYKSKTSTTKKEFALFSNDKINDVSFISIKNRFGVIKFIKESPSPYPWIISSHNNLLAETKKIEAILKNLKEIRVKRQIKADQISLKNYSLDNPFLEINYLFPGQSITSIKIGLINDFKKIAYIQHGRSEGIFEVSYRSLAIFDNNFSNFTNNLPFAFLLKPIKKIELERSGKKVFSLEKIKNGWTSQRGKSSVKKEKVETWLNSLAAIKADFILDKVSRSQRKRLENAQVSWRLTKLIVHTDKNTYEYDIYNTPNIVEKDGRNPKHYILIDKFRAFPIILSKETKKLLNFTSRSFR